MISTLGYYYLAVCIVVLPIMVTGLVALRRQERERQATQ